MPGEGKYDVFYLPIDFQTDNNLGHAFINLVTPIDAEHFRSTYQGLALAGDRSNKICTVPTTRQGWAANVEYYLCSVRCWLPIPPQCHHESEVSVAFHMTYCMMEKYQPLLFETGLRARFPSSMKAVRPIRSRQSRGRLLAMHPQAHFKTAYFKTGLHGQG